MPRNGTWTETDGGGTGAAVTAVIVAVVVLFGGGTVAAVTAAVTELLITVAVIIGVLVAAAIALLAWWLHGRAARAVRDREAYAARVLQYEEGKRRAAMERHQRALELARASAPVIALDPAVIAAFARQSQPVRVLRGEVER